MPIQSSYIADGQQVEAVDLDSFADAASQMTGAALSSIIGVPDANVTDSPLTVVPGAGMSVVVGGNGQRVLVQSRLADYLPAQTVAIAAAETVPRYDLLAFKYADVIVPTGNTANFLDGAGNLSPQPTAFVYRGIQTTVVTGTPGGHLPSAPSGFDRLAQVLVPADATTITAADITLLLPTMTSLLNGLLGAGVSGVNGKTGAVEIAAGNGIAIDDSGPDIVVSGTGILSLNTQTGDQSIVADTANVTITPHGNAIGIGVVADATPALNVTMMTFGVSPWVTGAGTAGTPNNMQLTAGYYSVLAEFTGTNFSGGTVEMHFVVPAQAAGAVISVPAGIMYHFAYIDIIVPAGQTVNPDVLVSYTNGSAQPGGFCCKIIAYRVT